MSRRTMDELWREYYASVFPGGPPSDAQCEQERRTFYAGAFVILGETLRLGDLPEHVAIKRLSSLLRQCEEFIKSDIATLHERAGEP